MRPGIFKTRGLVISGCGLKWPDPRSGHLQLGDDLLAPVIQSLDSALRDVTWGLAIPT